MVKRTDLKTEERDDLPSFEKEEVKYPLSEKDRAEFEDVKKGTNMTPFRWKVYDAISKIPAGKVSTYKLLALHLKSSPRAGEWKLGEFYV